MATPEGKRDPRKQKRKRKRSGAIKTSSDEDKQELSSSTSTTATTSNEEPTEEPDIPEDLVMVDRPTSKKRQLETREGKRKKRKKLADITYYPKKGANSYYFVRDKYPMDARVTSKVNVSIKSQPVKKRSTDWPVYMSFCLEMRHRGKQSWQDTSDGSCSGPGEECCSFKIPSDVADGYIDKDGMLQLYLYDHP